MTRRSLTFLALFSLALPAFAAEGKPPATVADLAWVSGNWQGTMGGADLREEWSTPAGGAMTGSFRWIKDGKLQMYEFLVLEDSPQGPVLTFRHFNPGLIAWEEKDAPLRCPLAGGSSTEAAFACTGTATKLTFRRNGDNGLTVLLERQKDGKASTDEFVYHRAR